MRYTPALIPNGQLTTYLGNELRRIAQAWQPFYKEDGAARIEGQPDITLAMPDDGVFTVLGTDGSGNERTMIYSDPEGNSWLYSQGHAAMHTINLSAGAGLRVNGESANDRALIEFFNNAITTRQGFIWSTPDGNKFEIRNEVPADDFVLSATATGPATREILRGDPAGETHLMYAGTKHVTTDAIGLGIYRTSSSAPAIAFYNSGGSRHSYIQGVDAGNLLIIQNEVVNGGVRIRATATGPSNNTLINGDPTADVQFYYAGALKAATAGDGFGIYSADTTTTNCVLRFRDSAGTSHTQFYHSMVADDFLFQNLQNSGRFRFLMTNSAGNSREIMTMDPDGPAVTFNSAAGGVVCGAPTGGDKGNGNINAKGVYDDNTLLTDYVFDALLDGRVDFQKWDDLVPNARERVQDARQIVEPDGRITELPAVDREVITRHEPARRFASRLSDLDPEAYANHWKTRRRLPAFDSPSGQPEQLPVGAWAQRLLETCEVQAVHIEKLREQLLNLEARLVALEV